MGKRIKITESQYGFILENKHLISEAEVKGETFNFIQAFPDNIAFPVKPGSNITNINQVGLANMTAELQEFIMKLKMSVGKGSNISNVKIQSGASSAKATNAVPKGYTPELVKLSYTTDGKVIYDNKVIASNRGKAIKNILERLIPQLKGKISEPETFIGKKTINVTIPSGILVNLKNNPKFQKEYVIPKNVFNPKTNAIKVTKCGQPIKATGSAGISTKGFLADQIQIAFDLNYSGDIQFNANSFMIPDRFLIMKINPKTKKTEKVADSGFITSLSNTDDSFVSLQNELKNVMGQELKGGTSSFSHTIKKEAGFNYYISIYAPFGGTFWSANIKCSEQPQHNQTKQPQQNKGVTDNYSKIYINHKTGEVSTTPKNSDFDIAMDGKVTKSGSGTKITDYKITDGKLYNYDDDNLLDSIRMYKAGKDVGAGKIN